MSNRENNVSRAGNTQKHVGKLGNTVSATAIFLNLLEKLLLPGKQILLPQQCFPKWANSETLGPFIREKISRVLSKSRLIQDGRD